MPIMGQPSSTIIIPVKNEADAFHLCRWKKNRKVLSTPIMNVNPEMNNKFPTASKPLSKNSIIPSIKNAIPNAERPRPIFCVSLMEIIFLCISKSARLVKDERD